MNRAERIVCWTAFTPIACAITACAAFALPPVLLAPNLAHAQESVPEMVPEGSDPLGEFQSVYVQSVGGPTGLKAYAAGQWGLVGATITNRTSKSQIVEATAMVGDNETLRFSRSIVVPAKTTRATTIPIHIPEGVQGEGPIRLVGRAIGGDQTEAVELDFLARLLPPSSVAFISDSSFDRVKPDYGFDFEYESVIALRAALALDRRLLPMSTRLLPAAVEAWDAVDIIVLSGNRTSDSPAVRQALRQWLSEGGKMWIQMNRTSPETVRELLGSALEMEVVDRVKLNDFEISFSGRGSLSMPFPVSVEEPIELVRAVVENADVLYEIDQWPAMFRIPFGRGEVYFTTLGGRGWIRKRTPDDPPYADPLFYTDFMPSDPLRELAVMIRKPVAKGVAEGIADEETASNFVTARVGYEIPGRGLVVGLLLGFCGVVGISSVLLGAAQRREYLGWFTVVGGLVTAGIILVTGWNSKKDVPRTASSIQIVEMLPESGEYISKGFVAVFNGNTDDANMVSTSRTRIDPQSADLSGKIRNFVWSDATRWKWRDTELPPGIQIFDFDTARSLSQPIVAHGKFTARGLSGNVDLSSLYVDGAELYEGGLLVFPHSAAMAANLNPDGSFEASIGDVLASGQYFNSTLITDAQRQQQAIYDNWYKRYIESLNPNPYLLAWVEDFGTDFQWPEDVKVRDAAMLAIPLTLQRNETAEQIAIPAPAIVMRAVISATGQSSVFDNEKRSWLFPYIRASSTRIRFQLPKQTLPLKPMRATLDIDCNIPSRDLEISIVDGNESRPIAKRTNASGKLSFQLNEEDLPRLDEAGGLTLQFAVSELSSEVEEETLANSAWSIRSTQLSVTGGPLVSTQD